LDNDLTHLDTPIAITGMGLVTAHGATPHDTWVTILRGATSPAPMPAMEAPLPAGADGYQAVDLPSDYRADLPREARYLRWTIEQALQDAGLNGVESQDLIPPARRSIALGTTLHGMRAAGRFYRSGDYAELKSFLAGDILRSAIDGLNIGGAAVTTCSACSSSLGSIALGMTLLRTGQADVVIAGGYDAVSEYVWAGFNALRLIADGPLRPFTRDRRGMKLGEGYAIVVLERVDDAERRGAASHGIIQAYGESADAHHLTQPQPQGRGALAAMQQTLRRAGAAASEIDLMTAHATGTPDNDAAEFAAMEAVLGERLPQTPVVAFKSHIGHTLGAAGAAELVLSSFALKEAMIPPTANVDPAAVEFAGLCVTNGTPIQRGIRHSLNTSLGFGGANTSVLLSKPADTRPKTSATPLGEVWITGLGVVLPGAVGMEAFVQRLRQGRAASLPEVPAALRDSDYEHLLNARRVRRMSGYAKLMLAAAQEACARARLSGDTERLAATGAMLGTTHGAASFCHDYYSQVVRDGVLSANPVLFAEGVPNVGAAHLSLMLGLKGGCQTIIGTRTAGLDALRLAWLRVASGEVDRLIVGAAEESCAVVDEAYRHCGLRASETRGQAFRSTDGFVNGPGAVAFVVESAASAQARGVMGLAAIDHAAAGGGSASALPKTLDQLLDQARPTDRWIASANATWLDAVEAAALERHGVTAIGTIYDIFGEVFSVSPLIGLAAVLSECDLPAAPGRGGSGKAGELRATNVLCTDWQGGAVSVRVRPLD